ncbi:neuroglobin isoform X1 [Aplysia californica]|uniref:Globin n=1 Tax=Aplysia californica TaxID=6500 RepID=A0ABM0JF71_APLCA|nr:neuroglobin isoform X1 [Aplysia californica]XP_005092315.1 neuroglobin isoform X1 [Aplysia californica]
MGCPWSKQHKTHSRNEQTQVPLVNGSTGHNCPYYMTENGLAASHSMQKDIDPRLPFNKQQIFKLLQSWRGIKRNMSEAGVEMFAQLFKTSSHLQTMFQGFKDIRSDDELRSNEALEYHATLVMTTLDDAITHIDNYDFVKQLLSKTGASHVKFAGFKSTNFLAIKEPFLEAVRVTLGDRYTENMQNIYTIAIIFILETLKQGMEEALEKAGSSEVAQGNIRV